LALASSLSSNTYQEVVVKKHWHLILGLTLLIVLVILLATGIIPL
jgi:hypothetical protein